MTEEERREYLEGDDATQRLVFPTQTGIGYAPKWGVVVGMFDYKLSSDEPEVFRQRYALTIEQATYIAHELLAAVQDLVKGTRG